MPTGPESPRPAKQHCGKSINGRGSILNDYKSYHGPIGTPDGSYNQPIGTVGGSYHRPVGKPGGSYNRPVGTTVGSYDRPVGTPGGSYHWSARAFRGSDVNAAQRDGDQPYSFFTSFLNMNPETGYLVFEVHEDSPVRGRLPVPGARVTVSKPLGGVFYFTKIVETDESGWTEPIPLPTVSRDLSLRPGGERVFTSYHASIEAPGYERQDLFEIEVFDGITSVQHVALRPNGAR